MFRNVVVPVFGFPPEAIMLSTADFWFPLSAHPLSLDRIARIEGCGGAASPRCNIHAMTNGALS